MPAKQHEHKKQNGALEHFDQQQKTLGEKVKAIFMRNLLMFLIIIAVILGFAIGIGINSSVQKLEEPTKTTVLTVLGFLGELLMNMLKMLILPLIISSLIVGLAALDQQSSGRLGARTIGYYMGTTILAVILGIILVLIIQPGSKATQPGEKEKQRDVIALDSILDLIRYKLHVHLPQYFLSQRGNKITMNLLKMLAIVVTKDRSLKKSLFILIKNLQKPL